MSTILVADSERGIRNSLKERLEYEGYLIQIAESSEEVLSKISSSEFDTLLFDPELLLSGSLPAFVEHLFTISPALEIILLAGNKNVDTVVECIRAGAYDYILKPIDLGRLLRAIKNINSSKSKENGSSPPPPKHEHRNGKPRVKNAALPDMVGESEGIKRIFSLIEKVASSDARVLIYGANGTGKELVARWIHEKSSRMSGPFVEVNCAAIPSELIESELFGHEKGSFTSAIKQRKGKFEMADGGTLFLDEIGDMSLAAQSKMLRALQEKRISRIGGDHDITVDVRVLAATNKNLEEEIRLKNFREDLYHRLSVIKIRVPSLAERRSDIPRLVNHFLEEVCAEYSCGMKKIDPRSLKVLEEMEWPGNIRQLRNVVERLVVLSENDITLEDVNMYVVQN